MTVDRCCPLWLKGATQHERVFQMWNDIKRILRENDPLTLVAEFVTITLFMVACVFVGPLLQLIYGG